MTNNDLIKSIERYANRAKIAPATVTSRAVGSSRLYGVMKKGGTCTLTVAERIQKYISANVVSSQ